MKKKIIIVGAGISGLVTGFYAQLNGFDTEIFEMHDIPGGLCTAWTRGGYTFDTSMHFLMHSKEGPFKKLWDELGITERQEFYYNDSSSFIDGIENKLDFCTDRLSLERQMTAISPEDSDLITEFLDLYFDETPMAGIPLDAPEVMGLMQKIKMLNSMKPMFKLFKKYAGLSIQDFASRFNNDFLRRAVRYNMDSPGWPMPDFPFVFFSGGMKATVIDSGYPLGGSKKAVFGIAERYEKSGGIIHYGTRAVDVIIENNRAAGIQLKDGSIHNADIIVWCADGRTLIYDILKGQYTGKKIKKMYQQWTPVNPIVQVLFGVDMDLSAEPNCIIHETKNTVKVGKKEFSWLQIMSHCFDKSTSPEGKSAIEVWYAADYEYWKALSEDRAKYNNEKKRIASETADALELKWPGFKSRIEVTDVATPTTYERYTGNWLGSPDGWHITVDNVKDQSMRKSLPGLKNLYMNSQWCAPFTGTVSTSLGGRQLVQMLCKKSGVEFKTTYKA